MQGVGTKLGTVFVAGELSLSVTIPAQLKEQISPLL